MGGTRRDCQVGGGALSSFPAQAQTLQWHLAPRGGGQSCRGAAGGGGNLSSLQVPWVHLLEAQEIMISWVQSLTLSWCSGMGDDVVFITGALTEPFYCASHHSSLRALVRMVGLESLYSTDGK